jgi:predicted phage baseplate assembly protein
LPLQLDPTIPVTRQPICLFSLPSTDTGGLGFLGPSLRETRPEILLTDSIGIEWEHTTSLLDADSTQDAFTLEDGTWRRIVAFQHIGEEIIHSDYATGAGYTIRFGDDVFGRIPPEDTVFTVSYRLNPGVLANVSADTIINPPAADVPLPLFVSAVTNPWPVLDGVDPESASNIKLFTPEAFKAELFFAVTPDDYGTQAARLPFVQRGFGTFRWTGSWTTVFASADPFGSFTLSDEQRSALEGWLDCVRQAGRDVIVQNPRFRTLDLEITICVEPFAYAGQVSRLVSEVLLGRGVARPIKGFFNPDNFTFGTPLRRSALEAVIQEVPGVRSVLNMRQRSRGRFDFQSFDQLTLDVDADEVIQLENDPTHPERGSLRIITTGGA